MNLFHSLRTLFSGQHAGSNEDTALHSAYTSLSQSGNPSIAQRIVQSVLDSSSTIYSYLAQAHPTWFHKITADPYIGHVITTADNNIGVSLYAMPTGFENRKFDATQPIIFTDILDDRSHIQPEHFLMVLHDCRHYVLGGPMPFRRIEGNYMGNKLTPNIEIISRDEFVLQQLLFENEALFFSEIHCPRVIGYEEFRTTLGRPSIGEVLEKLGLHADEEQKEAIHDLSIDQILPHRADSRLSTQEYQVLVAIVNRGKIDRQLAEALWGALTKEHQVINSACSLAVNPQALDFEQAQAKIDQKFQEELKPLNHDPLQAYILHLRNAITRKKFEELRAQILELPPGADENYTWKSFALSLEKLLDRKPVHAGDLISVLEPFLERNPNFLTELTRLPIHPSKVSESSLPSPAFFDPEKLKFEYPSNYAATGWEPYVVSTTISGRSASLQAIRKYHDFVGWTPGSNERGPLQLNFHFWPDARAYGYKARAEGKTSARQEWYLTVVEPMPDFSYSLLSANILRDYGGDLVRDLSMSEARRLEFHESILGLFNFGFSALGYKECSFIRKALLITPFETDAFSMKGDTLESTMGHMTYSDVRETPLLTRYGHEILERIIRCFYGGPSLTDDELKNNDRFDLLLSRYFLRENNVLTVSHLGSSRLFLSNQPITLLARWVQSKRTTKPIGENFLKDSLSGTLDPQEIPQHPELRALHGHLNARGNSLRKIASKKLALLERYGSDFEIRPYVDSEGSIPVDPLLNCLLDSPDSFPQFMLSNFKYKTLQPIITYLRILEREITSLIETNDELLIGGSFHGQNACKILGTYANEFERMQLFYDPGQLVDEDLSPTPFGRFLRGTLAQVSVDELVDGGTRAVNETLRGIDDVLVPLLHLDWLLTPVEVEHYRTSCDIFGKIELLASLLCARATNGAVPHFFFDPLILSFNELEKIVDLTPYELFDKRKESIKEQSLLTAEIEHDINLPEDMLFSGYAFAAQGARVCDEQYISLNEFADEIIARHGRAGLFTLPGIYPDAYRRIPTIRFDSN